ncbi:uncharacterized protein LOC127252543 [Andrographis paniculata]|uniref:uncharacterized protein LOC127252543 n=1 Tax=Andrographis paniculata TaxID=175694 RepID=UPI0021E90673|nr:uncharacterized protein LOC127252543 [Andrographis paniculata]
MDSTAVASSLKSPCLVLLLFIQFTLLCSSSPSSSGSFLPTLDDSLHHKINPPLHQHQHKIDAIRRDFLNPGAGFPGIGATPVTNPVTTPSTAGLLPPVTPTVPTIVTVPSANPVNPPAVTNPVTTPGATLPQPVTSPSSTPLGANNPVAGPGQSWCVARSGVPDSAVQSALDYACGIGGADCSAIQDGASCYNPSTLQYHASYAFNSYYQRNPVPTSCDFGGTATITNVNPSFGSCIFTTWSPTTTSSPTAIPTPTPTTETTSGATPTSISGATQPMFNPGDPSLGGGAAGYGNNPLMSNTSSVSAAQRSSQPFIILVAAATSMITGRVILGI